MLQLWVEQKALKKSDVVCDLNVPGLSGKGNKTSWITMLGKVTVIKQFFNWTAGGGVE